MRKVKVFKYNHSKENSPIEEDGLGKFHQFGVAYEQFDEGVGNFTIAIVEMEDGTVRNIPVELIQFLD